MYTACWIYGLRANPNVANVLAELLAKQTKKPPNHPKWGFTVTYKIEARAEV